MKPSWMYTLAWLLAVALALAMAFATPDEPGPGGWRSPLWRAVV